MRAVVRVRVCVARAYPHDTQGLRLHTAAYERYIPKAKSLGTATAHMLVARVSCCVLCTMSKNNIYVYMTA